MNTVSPRRIIASAGLPFILANREGDAKRWIHIVPKGELPNKGAGVVQVLDDQALDSILGNLNADAQRLGSKWPGLYMGEEHFIYDSDKSSQAFVWGKEFQKRADGIWAAGDETDIGRPALENKRFKFTSFVADPAQPGAIEKLDGNRIRILKIDTVGFTNFANGRHLLTPVTNRGQPPANNQNNDMTTDKILNGDYSGHEFHGNQYTGGEAHGAEHEASRKAHLASAAAHETTSKENHLAAAHAHEKAAGLHEKAGDEEAASMHRAVAHYHSVRAGRFQNRDFAGATGPAASQPQPPKEKMKEIAKQLGVSEDSAAVSLAITKLLNRSTEMETEQCESLMDAHGLKADDAKRAHLLPALKSLKNRAERTSFLTEVCPAPAMTGGKGQVKLFNRDTKVPGAKAADPADEVVSAELAVKIKNRASELKGAAPARTFEACWAQAKTEVK